MTDLHDKILTTDAIGIFPEEARRALYEIISLRRDVRHFIPGAAIDDAAFERIIQAAHYGPSVGFSQPWGFVVIREPERRARIRESFLRCREAEAARYPEERRAQYLSYRLEGLIEASFNLCVTVDLRPRDEAILGTTAQPEAVRASVACAIENLWLAARAEGIGVGWVSIVEPQVLRRELALPRGVHPVAYLCVGQPIAYRKAPMLEELGWQSRRPFDSTVHHEVWSVDDEPSDESLEETARVSPLSRARLESRTAKVREIEQQARLTKPRGSLGRLEELSAWYADARGEFPVRAPNRFALGLFMADHGVAVEGVSAYSSEVTAAMACNVMAGGAAVNVLARRNGVTLLVTDVGIAGDLSAAPQVLPGGASADAITPLRRASVRAGTRNLRVTFAMTDAECQVAIAVGREVARDAVQAGALLLGVGEVGIGNTTSAAALICALTSADPDALSGHGTGIDETVRRRKAQVIKDALLRHPLSPERPKEALASVGGLEIAAMVGFLLEAARLRTPVVLDGVVTLAAALTAHAIDPGVLPFLIASHRSPEPAFDRAATALNLRPILDLGLRLGEGTGAVLAMPLVANAVALTDEMATFATMGVVRVKDTP